jgi:hypothetical protein
MIFTNIQSIIESAPLDWGTIAQLVIGTVVGGYVIYRFGWDKKQSTSENQIQESSVDSSQDTSQSSEHQSHHESGDVSQNVEFNFGPNESGSTSKQEEEEDPRPKIKCHPQNLDTGMPDVISEEEDQIRTFDKMAEARILVQWPNELERCWVMVEAGEGVFIEFKNKPESMTFRDDGRFKMGDNATKKYFDMEISAPNLSGSHRIEFRETSNGDILADPELVGL